MIVIENRQIEMPHAGTTIYNTGFIIHNMKNMYIITLLCISLISCNSPATTTNFLSKETLIKNDSKIMGRGYFTFLVFVNENEINEIVYYYIINNKTKSPSCSKINEKRYNVNEYIKEHNVDRFETAKQFATAGKYYAYLVDNFLDMTNDEKIVFLNKLSSEKNSK
ncbi:hypothetical protein [uncultured Bacteroides sp.]|uniref:hypothetical protein n=3 Tax=uncultured Bacteroides sp. TaxID=162156 RepID=UPI0025DEB689|nr:hypothetical protein [uncultured Bacteroides sp.]